MTRGYWLCAVGLIAAVSIGSVVVHGSLPERVPTHWNLQGQVDGYGSRSMAAFLMPALMVGILGLLSVLPKLSPAQFKMESFRSTYGFIVVVVLSMMGFIHVVAMMAAMGNRIDVTKLMVAGAMLAIGLIGNVLGKVRRNFFVGVRVPWTLASERVWNETHRLAAWITFGGGLVGAAVALLGYPIVALVSMVPIVLIPVVFSLLRYKQLERHGEL